MTKEAREEIQAVVIGAYEEKVRMMEAGEAIVSGGAGDAGADLHGEELPFA